MQPHDETEISPLVARPDLVGTVAMALQRSKKKLLAGFAFIGFLIMITQLVGYRTMTK